MKNFLVLSPHYPQRVYFFAKALKEHGFRVLGIGDGDYDSLNDTLKSSLTEYVHLPLHCYSSPGVVNEDAYQAIYGTVAYLISKYGRIAFVESFNEFWLPLESKLREDFNIEGPKPADLAHYIRKSYMKPIFKRAGAEVARGELIKDLDHLLAFLDTEKDIIVKPDIGVGASDTRRVRTREQAETFYKNRNQATTYFMEQFIGGKNRELISFDGFTGPDGAVVIHFVHSFCEGIMEVAGGVPLSYFNYLDSEIPEKFRQLGLRTVKEFGLRKRWFHIEFFAMDGKYWGVEVNSRPPGVLVLDGMNFARGFDVWDLYATMAAGEKPEPKPLHDWTSAYCARRNTIQYAHHHKEIVTKYGNYISLSMPMDNVVMGDFAYIVVAPEHETQREVMAFIDERMQ